ncbi:MAG: ribonuclease P protein component [Deltaproteobacteria bacterium]
MIATEENTPPNSRARSRLDRGFSRSERLVTKDAYDAVYKRGKRVRISTLSFAYAPNDLGFNRLGISVGKAFGNAVRRNQAKRIIRELFRRNKNQIPQGYDIVASPQRGFLDLEWQELEKTYLTFASLLKGEKGS